MGQPPPPPPTPQVIGNLLSNKEAPTSSNHDQQARSDYGSQSRANTGTQNCDSMHTQNCTREISGFVIPHIEITGTFGLLGGETTKLGPKYGGFVIVGDDPEEGGYISGIGEMGVTNSTNGASLGYEQVLFSSKKGFLPNGVSFWDVNSPAGVGVMVPLMNNLKSLATKGLEGEYELSPYVFTSVGPIEYGAGADLNVSLHWGWRSFPSQ